MGNQDTQFAIPKHDQRTTRKDGIDIEECWPWCRQCRIDALESQLAALTEKMPCGHPRLFYKRMMRLPKNSAYPGFAENHAEDGWCPKAGCKPVFVCGCVGFHREDQPAHSDQFLMGCTACADRDARVRLERDAAFANGYTAGYADGEEGYAFDAKGRIPAADASALAEHDAAMLEKYTKINHLLIGSSARDFAEKFFHGHIDFVGSMQPAVKIKGFISALENAVQMFVDAYVQQKVAAEAEWWYRRIDKGRAYIRDIETQQEVEEIEQHIATIRRAASPSGDRGGAASDGGDKSEGASK